MSSAAPLTPALPAELNQLAGMPVLRLMQLIEAHKAQLGPAQTQALYEDWLRTADPREAYVGHYNLGALCQTSGQPREAVAHYRRALLQRELPEARYNLGLALEQQGRLHEAMAEWRRIDIEGAPLRLMALTSLIRVARRCGQEGTMQRYMTKSLSLNADQSQLTQELQQIKAGQAANEQDRPRTGGGGVDPVIHVVAVCFNEAAILPFFLDHYIHFVGARKIVLHDGGSSDGTAEIAARYPQVELVVKKSDKLDDRELMAIRNEEWKKHREGCDWMVVCDVDEFLYHPRLREKLAEFKREGVTLPMVEGFEMLSKRQPVQRPGRYLWEEVQTGFPVPRYYNKNLIFDPAIEINYLLGCHSCDPTGPVKRTDTLVFKNLHYRMLSHQHIVEKSRRAAARLSDWNKQTNAGFHYRHHAEMSSADYNKQFLPAYNVVDPRPRPVLQREAFEALQQLMLMREDYLRIVELGTARGFGSGADSGSTEFFAWYVHSFGGWLDSVDAEPRAARHARRELAARSLLSERAQFASELPAGAPIDLLFIGAADHLGDEEDLFQNARRALSDFTALEPQLAAGALVVLDGVLDEADFGGKHSLLAPYLVGRGYLIQQKGYTLVFAKQQGATTHE